MNVQPKQPLTAKQKRTVKHLVKLKGDVHAYFKEVKAVSFEDLFKKFTPSVEVKEVLKDRDHMDDEGVVMIAVVELLREDKLAYTNGPYTNVRLVN